MKLADESKENLTGIYIPSELAANTTLNWSEKAVYSIYHYFTYFGQSHCCRLTNDTICERLGIKERSLQRIKNDLTNNGYITVKGITVKALKEFAGVTLLTPIANDEQRGDTFDTHSEQNTGVTLLTPIAVEQPRVTNMVDGVTNMVVKGDTFDTHNKENKEINKVTYLLSDSHQSDDPINNITYDLGLYVEDNTPEIPEWMLEIQNEPFEQYTDDAKTTDTFHTEDEKPTDTVTDKVINNKGWFEDVLNNALQTDETEETNLTEYEDVLPSDLSNPNNPFLGAPVDYLKADGTITHTDPESLSNRLKTTSVDLPTDETETDNNKNNTSIPMELTLTERKAKQAEITQKWKNFIQQVPTMDRETADKYLNNFIVAANKYFTGEYIERITTQWREQFEFTAKPPFDIEQAKRIVENAVNNYAEQNTIARTLYSIFCKPVNRQWLETTIAEAKQKRETDKSRYNSYGDLPF